MGDCAIDKGSLILLLPLETLFKFDMFINKEWLWEMLISNTYKMFTNDPKDVHKNHMRQPTYPHFDIIIIGDSTLLVSLIIVTPRKRSSKNR